MHIDEGGRAEALRNLLQDFARYLVARNHDGPVAEGRTIEYLALGMKTSAHAIGTSFLVEILDANGHKIAQSKETVTTSSQWLNHDIRFESIPVLKDAQYKIRLTSPGYAHESDITWLATPADSYKSGHAVVDGVSRNSDFLFRIVFAK